MGDKPQPTLNSWHVVWVQARSAEHGPNGNSPAPRTSTSGQPVGPNSLALPTTRENPRPPSNSRRAAPMTDPLPGCLPRRSDHSRSQTTTRCGTRAATTQMSVSDPLALTRPRTTGSPRAKTPMTSHRDTSPLARCLGLGAQPRPRIDPRCPPHRDDPPTRRASRRSCSSARFQLTLNVSNRFGKRADVGATNRTLWTRTPPITSNSIPYTGLLCVHA
jgi:hypothetical protein